MAEILASPDAITVVALTLAGVAGLYFTRDCWR